VPVAHSVQDDSTDEGSIRSKFITDIQGQFITQNIANDEKQA